MSVGLGMQTGTRSPNAPTPALGELRVELLRGCPLLCAHCSAHASPKQALQLAPERVLRLIDEFAALGGRRATLTGGEPLMYPELETVLRRCQSHGIATRLFSSGIVQPGGAAAPRSAVDVVALERYAPYVGSIAYSIYARTPAVHDALTRITGSFHLTLEAIRRTIVLRVGSELHFVPTQGNYRELPAVVELADDLGVGRVGVLRFVPHGRGEARAGKLLLDRPAHLWLRRAIIELRERFPRVSLHVGSAYNLLGLDDQRPCTAALDQLVIEADGRIAPCSGFGNFRVEDEIGNVLEHPLRVVWERSAFLTQVREVLSLRAGSGCAGCLAQGAIADGRISPHAPDPLVSLIERGVPDALASHGSL